MGELALHPTLARQLRRLGLGLDGTPDQASWQRLLAGVSDAYSDNDQHRYLTERSMRLSSTEMRALHEELHASRARLEAVFDSASIGLCVLDASGAIETMNRSAEALFGHTEEVARGVALWDLVSVSCAPHEDRSCGPEEYRALLDLGQSFEAEDAEVRAASRTFPAAFVLTPLVGETGEPTGAVLVLRDISEHRTAQALLSWQANHDTLTGLPNRGRIHAQLDELLRVASNQNQTVSALFIDLDRFKNVNDSLGHAAGDVLLGDVVSRITRSVREHDVVGRLSGDEFVVICAGLERDRASTIAQRIVGELEKPFWINDVEILISASIGVSAADGSSTAASLLAEADEAMYRAKQAGRGCVRIFDDSMRTAARRRVTLETGLRQAVKRGLFDVAFHAQVELGTKRLSGYELLSRWSLADGEMVSPTEFVPLAEDLGLIQELGVLVFDQAVRAHCEWAGAIDGLGLAINVSGRQLQGRTFVDRVGATVRDLGLDPERFTLEVTESVFLDDISNAMAQLGRLRDIGVRLAVDDFGAGYSSLSYLRRIPAHEIKLDRAFVHDLASSREDRAIVEGVILLCHALGRRVVVEGVETREQLEILESMGADAAQGWYFARPVPEETARHASASGRVVLS